MSEEKKLTMKFLSDEIDALKEEIMSLWEMGHVYVLLPEIR